MPACTAGVVLTLALPWVKLGMARQLVERSHILGKRMHFTASMFGKIAGTSLLKKRSAELAFAPLALTNWLQSLLSFGLSRIVADTDWKEVFLCAYVTCFTSTKVQILTLTLMQAQWLDRHIEWPDN